MEDDANWAPYERLALMTVRLFHNLPEYYVMKAILTAPRQLRGAVSHPELQLDDRIAERLRMTMRYVRTLLAKLKADGLVIEVAPQAKAGSSEEGKTAGLTAPPEKDNAQKLYGVDFEVLADSVMFKLDAMDRRLKQQQAPKLHAYRCTRCGLRQSALEVDYNTQLNAMTGGLSCPSGNPECFGVELVEEDNTDARAVVEAHRAAVSMHLSGLQKALRDVAELPPPTYKRPRLEEGDAAPAASKAGKVGISARGGASCSSCGGSSSNSLGASRGIAAAVGSGSGAQPLPPWMLSKAQADAVQARAGLQRPAQQTEQAVADAQAEEEFMQFMKHSSAPPAASASASQPPSSLSSGVGVHIATGVAGQVIESVGTEDGEDGEEEDDPEVLVQGKPMLISEVSQADIERMSDEEHQRYYALYQSLVA